MKKTYNDIFRSVALTTGYPDITFTSGGADVEHIKTCIKDEEKLLTTVNQRTKNLLKTEITTTSGVYSYTIPTEVKTISDIFYVKEGSEDKVLNLKYMNYDLLINRRDESDFSEVVFYTIYDGKIILYGTPKDSTSKIRIMYIQRVSLEVVDPTSNYKQNVECGIEEAFELILEAKVIRKVYLRLDNTYMADKWLVEIDRLLPDYKKEVSQSDENCVLDSPYLNDIP